MRALHSGHIVRFGYRPNPDHAGELAIRTAHHADALRLLAATDDNGDRFLYRALLACLQAAKLSQWLVQDGPTLRLNCYDQGQTSGCTSHGHSIQLAIGDALACVAAGAPAANSAASQDVPTFRAMPAPETIYPFGLEVDGTLGRDDGCSGSGIVEGTERYGSYYELPAPGSADELPQGNWANSPYGASWYQRFELYATNGVPAAIAAAAASHKSQSHANVTSVADAWTAIGAGYAVLICSNVSFEADRNEEGIIGMTGHRWPHCMCVSSRRTSPRYGRLYLIHQSWAPAWTAGPYYLDQPVGSFWIRENDLAQILVCRWDRRTVVRDCWVSGGHQGFLAQPGQLPIWLTHAA